MRAITLLFAIALSNPIISQTAVIFDFNFDVAPSLRQQLPKYDLTGNIKGHYVGQNWVEDTTRETLNADYVESICETLQAALLDVYGFDTIAIAYPKGLSINVDPSRMDGFPKYSLKKASKRHDVDYFIECTVSLKGRSSGYMVVMNKQREASLKVNAEITVTALRPDGNIEETKSISINDLTTAFDETYVARTEDEYTRVMGAEFLSQSDIERIFLASLQALFR